MLRKNGDGVGLNVFRAKIDVNIQAKYQTGLKDWPFSASERP
jgi:hypothetical protein